jgi:hypothetical protein
MLPVTPANGTVQAVSIPDSFTESADLRARARVAVFPLANPDGGQDVAYLRSGIPGSVIRGLSPLPRLDRCRRGRDSGE